MKSKCPDCGAKRGERHQHGCDVQRCPICGGQLLTCDCVYEVNGYDPVTLSDKHPDLYNEGATEAMWVKFDAEVEKRGGYDVWDGEWPGITECRKRGWYAQDGHGPDHRWGSFCPCSADTPGAKEDLNRWVWFKRTGKDTLYEGCDRVPRAFARAERACCDRPWPQKDPHEGGWRCGTCLEPLVFASRKWAATTAQTLLELSVSGGLNKDRLSAIQNIKRDVLDLALYGE